MRTRGIWMLWAALAAGLVAVVLAMQWMQGQGAGRDRIAVASVDIGLGTRLTPQMVRMTEWPGGSVPSGAFASLDTLDGRVVTVAVLRGEPLTEARLAPVGARAGLSAVVPPGKRAMTVRVNDVVGVAGFALPGTTVDVLVNTQHEGGRRGDSDRAISKIVLERILVLAVAQEADRDASRPKVVSAVTLEVTPEQAEKLDLARSVGSLSLVLRNPSDPLDAATRGATKSALLGTGTSSGAAPTPVAVRVAGRSPKGVPMAPGRWSGTQTAPTSAAPARDASSADKDVLAAPEPQVEPAAGRLSGSPGRDIAGPADAAPKTDLAAVGPTPVTAVVAPSLGPPATAGAATPTVATPPDSGRGRVVPASGLQATAEAERVAPRRVCVEILAGATRRTECF